MPRRPEVQECVLSMPPEAAARHCRTDPALQPCVGFILKTGRLLLWGRLAGCGGQQWLLSRMRVCDAARPASPAC